MEHVCPICQRQLRKDGNNAYVDYDCFPPKPDHHYTRREESSNGTVLAIKVRIGSKSDRLYFKVNYSQGFTQVWTDPDNEESKIRINHIFEPALTDLDALRQKLKTYMVFS